MPVRSFRELPCCALDVVSASYDDVERLAETVRDEMGLGRYPADTLFSALEDAYSVLVFYQDLGADGSAVCMRGAFGAVMLLNQAEAPWRRTFSCAHELFHLLTWDEQRQRAIAQDRASFEQMERRAEAFASALLLPEATLHDLIPISPGATEFPVLTLIQAARHLGVSTDALLWRLVNLRWISRDTRQGIALDEGFRRADRNTMREQWWTPPELPTRYVELALARYLEGKLSRAKMASLLEVDLDQLEDRLKQYGLSTEYHATYKAEIRHP
jgi:Zn-dependent peptidase ImmA (M78 family)